MQRSLNSRPEWVARSVARSVGSSRRHLDALSFCAPAAASWPSVSAALVKLQGGGASAGIR
jgi:hypothetical protein